MAYSSLIDHHAFDKYAHNTREWRFLFSLILAVIAVTGFFTYGELGDEMDNPEALQTGMIIGFMFILIGFLSGRTRAGSRTRDGVVVDKKVKSYMKDTGYSRKVRRQVYVVYIKDDSGIIHEIRNEDDDTVFHYFKIGDKVRYHGKLKSYEKFDKSGDDIIFCNACAFLHDMNEDICRNCGCPLLK